MRISTRHLLASRFRIAVVTANAIFTGWPSLAHAQATPGGNIELSAFRPTVGARGFVTVDGADALESGQVSFGLVSTWAHRLLDLRGDDARYRIEHVVTPTLVAAAGLPLAAIDGELGLSIPLGVVSGDRITETGRRRLRAQGLGDVGLHGKLQIGRGNISAAAVAVVTLPTATPESWLGAAAFGAALRGIVEARGTRFRGGLSAGARLQAGASVFMDVGSAMPSPMRVAAGSALQLGAGLSYLAVPGRVDALAEVAATVPFQGDHVQPAEVSLAARIYMAARSHLTMGVGTGVRRGAGNPDVRAFIGIQFEPRAARRAATRLPTLDLRDRDPPPTDPDEDGIFGELDGCPTESEDVDGFQDGDGCPDLDNDEDGFLDVDDLCPDQAEDRDGIDDGDGCPELDADRDRLLDHDDECPTVPESWNGYRDGDGCPDRSIVNVGDSAIEVLREIHFDFNSAKIQARSFSLLAQIAEAIRQNPELLQIEISGHTDERGSDDHNLALSKARAAAIRDHLVEQGVDPRRLVAEGYGETRPKLRQSSPAAWRANRRVEFLILRRR